MMPVYQLKSSTKTTSKHKPKQEKIQQLSDILLSFYAKNLDMSKSRAVSGYRNRLKSSRMQGTKEGKLMAIFNYAQHISLTSQPRRS